MALTTPAILWCCCDTVRFVFVFRWVDAGKFLTGFSAVGSMAIPAVLAHAQVGGHTSSPSGLSQLKGLIVHVH